jgi:hypothetical protein
MRNHPFFPQFPIEVVDEIAKYVAVRELKVLCLVSRQTGDVATRWLYHTILLNELMGLVGCLRTLVGRRDVARCVRMYVFDPFGEVGSDCNNYLLSPGAKSKPCLWLINKTISVS